eukprot:Lithocolla_globosa_v1_NODE_2039_length_2196_cov_20.511443.p2 type:complete len:327 gc:universal NODE_2039_length_2196_cov_20.511443:119-1099(+)
MSKSVVPAFRVRLLLNNNPPKLPLKATVSAAVSTLTKSVVRLLTTNFSADGKPWITVDGPSNLLTKEAVSTVNMESPLGSLTANFSLLATPLPITGSTIDGRKIDDLAKQIFAMSFLLNQTFGQITYTSQQSIVVGTPEADAIAADETKPIVNPIPVDNGWYFSNTLASSKINWYFFAQDANNTKQLGQITFCYSVFKTYVNLSAQSMPYLSVYTKPLGDGSDAGSWYRSRQTWKLAEANRLTLIPPNNKCLMYFGYQDPAVETGIPHFLLVKDVGTSVGPQLPTEELLTIALSTDSGAPVNSISFTCNNFGTAIGGESINRTLSS